MPLALFAGVAALALAASATGTGLVPDDAVALWAGAITAGDGELSIGSITAAYPSLPFLATTLLQFMTPAGTPGPALLAAGILALLAGFWFDALRRADFSLFAAGVAALLLAFHPMLLRAVVAGGGEMLLAAFLYIFGSALYDLRAHTGIPQIMAAGLALLAVAFSHPAGAAIAIAAIPFLAFTVRPTLIAGSAINVVLTLAFPAMFGAAAFAYVSWVFPGDGWRFFAASPESLAEWIKSLGDWRPRGFPTLPALDAGLAVAVALVLATPVAVAALVWVRRRRPLIAPAMVFCMTAVTAALFAAATGLFGHPATVTVAAPVLGAIVMTRVPIEAFRRRLAMLLLILGWAGGVAGLALVDPRAAAQISAALDGRAGDQPRIDALGLGGATVGHAGILVDTFNAPAVVLGRGQARGLLLPAGEPFMIAMLFSRVDTPFVAVPDPQSGIGNSDRLNKAFPFLYRDGAPGYRLIYQNNTWRLFERGAVTSVYKDRYSASYNNIIETHK
jgi:hypothetical protein